MSRERSCRYCPHCKQKGRQKATRYGSGKKHYYCTHADINKIDWYEMRRATAFISFGENTYESPILIKTHPKWCPIENNEKYAEAYKEERGND